MPEPTVTDPTETTIPTPAGAASGDNWQERVAKLEEKNAALEREKQGIYADAKEERRKRQELEAQARLAASKPAEDEETQRAKKFVHDAALEVITPVQRELERTKALNWLARQESKRTGKMVFAEDVETSPLIADLARIEQEKGLMGMGLVRSAQTAYELHLKESRDKDEAAKAAEAARVAAIEGAAPESTRTTSPTSGKHKWTNSELKALDVHAPDFDKKMDEVRLAIAEGRFDKNK